MTFSHPASPDDVHGSAYLYDPRSGKRSRAELRGRLRDEEHERLVAVPSPLDTNAAQAFAGEFQLAQQLGAQRRGRHVLGSILGGIAGYKLTQAYLNRNRAR